ncbi:acyl-CoA desaturase [Rurimicrobium arvi]|uniref:Acyl-CoA desaturase n=2 Tax=Rurimicrobium arvi TaxID=2049916 RepID=A0ABP8MYD7_9BACT
MSRTWERCFYIGCFITQGSSYISAYTYGLMHRLHHAHTDKVGDPHSPYNEPNAIRLMWLTRKNYQNLHTGKLGTDDKYKKNLPEWVRFDIIAHSGLSRISWVFIYAIIYSWLTTAWWQWMLFPFTVAMGSLQGVIVNWWAHKFGYENFDIADTSKNILPIDLIFWGEAYHNNHHKHPSNPNNAARWFEWDMGFQTMRLLNFFHIIKLPKYRSTSA